MYRLKIVVALTVYASVFTTTFHIYYRTKIDNYLVQSVEALDVNRVSELLEQGANPNSVWHKELGWEWHAKHFLSKLSHKYIYNPVQGPLEVPVLCLAAQQQPEQESKAVIVAQALLNKGASVDAQDDYGMTALMGAVAFHNVELVRLLLKNGADANKKLCGSDRTALKAAEEDIYCYSRECKTNIHSPYKRDFERIQIIYRLLKSSGVKL